MSKNFSPKIGLFAYHPKEAKPCPKCRRKLKEGKLSDVVAVGIHDPAADDLIRKCSCGYYEYAE